MANINTWGTNETEDQLLRDYGPQITLERFYFARLQRKPQDDKNIRAYKLFRSWIDETTYPYGTPVFVPFTFTIIETILPRLIRTLFSTTPYIKVLPRQDGDRLRQAAEAMEDLIDYSMYMGGAFQKLAEFLKSVLVYGYGFTKVFWREVDWHGKRLEIPDFESLDPFDVYPDPWATRFGKRGDADYIIHRVFRSYESIKRAGELGIYKNIEKVKGQSTYRPVDFMDRQERRLETGVPTPLTDTTGQKMVELLEMWTPNRVITLANREVELRNEKNEYGYIPFLKLDNYVVPKEIYGMGEPEVVFNHQMSLNDIRNNTLEATFQAMNPMYLASRLADIDPAQLVSRPAGVVWTNNVEAIKPLEVNTTVLQTATSMEEMLKQDMERASGVFDVVRGEAQQGEETATEILSRGENANLRFSLKIQYIEYFLAELGEMKSDMYQKFLSTAVEDAVIREGSSKFIKATPDQIQGEFLFQTVSRTISDAQKMALRQELTQVMPQVIQYGAQVGLNVPEIVREYISLFDWKNPDRFFIQQPAPQMTGPPGSPQGAPPPTAPMPGAPGSQVYQMNNTSTGPQGGAPFAPGTNHGVLNRVQQAGVY